jgi:pheromone shutdown-related protein TraB
MIAAPFPSHHYPEDVALLNLKDKTILLVGTAHISQQSTDLVAQVIEQEQPDAVCIELDEKRYAALAKRTKWENLDLKQVVRNKQLATLMVNLILATYQKKLGGQLGIMPGAELLAAARTAERLSVPVILCDRDVRVTLRRAWHATSLLKKGYLLATLLASLFDKTELDEEKLAEMRRQDVLSELINELGVALPHTKEVLIDERDIFMAEMIKKVHGQRLVAVVGAGHLEGIKRVINQDNSHLIETISIVPQVGMVWKILGWLIPGLIVLSLIAIGVRQGATEFAANAVYWILAHGIPSALGALIALAHPATIVSAFAAAPVTSLSPLIGAGYVCAFIQVMTCPPVVKEFEAVSADIATFKGWWHNKLLRIFLVFVLTTFGSSLGTWIGGYRIFNSLFN